MTEERDEQLDAMMMRAVQRSMLPAIVNGQHATAHALAPRPPELDWYKVLSRCCELYRTRVV